VNTVKRSKKYGEIAKYINNSQKLLTETWAGNEAYVATALDKAHSQNTSVLKYNDENSLSLVVIYAYMLANAYYTVVREFPTGNGFADIVFIPYHNDKPAMIVELKYDKAVDTAIEQIKNKNYPKGLEHYSGNMLLVGITYDTDSKKHVCKIERITK